MPKNKDKAWEPWKEYPNIWPTKAKFFAWLRGGLRLGLWNKSPIKITFKNKGVDKPPEGIETRAKTGAYCALTGEWTGKSKLEIDHKIGNVSLNDEDDILNFIKHLVPSYIDLQLVDKEAHKIKSFAERKGISFTEALAQKRAIAAMKQPIEVQNRQLTELGYPDNLLTNAKKRRECYEDYYSKAGT